MSKYDDLTTIIINYRIKNRWQRDITRVVLENIQMFTENYELIIIESDAGEYTNDLKKQLREEDTYLTFEENLFTSKANNMGANRAKGKYLIFLANDILVHQDWLNELIRHYKPKSPVKILGPNPNRTTPEEYEKMKVINKLPILEWNRCSFGSLHGGVFMEKKTFIEDIGGFDENMAFFFTDRDYNARVVKKGYHCCIIPTSLVTHLASMTWFYDLDKAAIDPKNIYNQEADTEYFVKKWGRNP